MPWRYGASCNQGGGERKGVSIFGSALCSVRRTSRCRRVHTAVWTQLKRTHAYLHTHTHTHTRTHTHTILEPVDCKTTHARLTPVHCNCVGTRWCSSSPRARAIGLRTSRSWSTECSTFCLRQSLALFCCCPTRVLTASPTSRGLSLRDSFSLGGLGLRPSIPEACLIHGFLYYIWLSILLRALHPVLRLSLC